LRVGIRDINEEVWTWVYMEFILLQILVVVANIQMKTLKADVEKGSVWTAIEHGLVDPKIGTNVVNIMKIGFFDSLKVSFIKLKGKWVKILTLIFIGYSRVTIFFESRDIKFSTGKSSLFYLTVI